jgi:hypothetical protein
VSSGTAQVTVQASIAGPSFTVDGSLYTTPQTFTWVSGSSHTITTTDPQSFATGSQYHWTGWSDSGGISHQVSPTTNTAYTANFTEQFLLTTNVLPSGSGSVAPSGGYYDSGASVSPTVNASAGYAFSNWTGDLSGSGNPQGLTMSTPHSVTANFQAVTVGQQSGFVTGFALNSPRLRNNYGNFVGMKLIVGSNPLSVGSVGRICATGNSQAHLVKFVSITSGGIDVPGGSASVNMAGCTPGQFVHTNLASPITLQAGGAYYLVSQENTNGDTWYDQGGISTTNVATVSDSVYFDGANWNLVDGANTSFVPPDFLYSVLSPPSPQPYVIDFNLDNSAARNNFSGFVGMEFTVGPNPVTVASLGRMCVAGNSQTHTVELVTTGGALVGSAEVNMAGCARGQFVYATPGNPITLLANTPYYLASQETNGGDLWYDHDALTTTNVATEHAYIYSADGANFIALGGANASYGPVNFSY